MEPSALADLGWPVVGVREPTTSSGARWRTWRGPDRLPLTTTMEV